MNEQEKLNRVPASGFADTDWRILPLVVIDFETSGLDPVKDRIVEYGLAFFENRRFAHAIGELVNPECQLTDEVMKIHGITNEQLANAQPFLKQCYTIENLLRGHIPVAYNSDFDREFLLNEVLRLVREALVARDKGELKIITPELIEIAKNKKSDSVAAFNIDVEWIDPLVWIRHFFKYEKSKKLTDICKKLKIELNSAHRATSDAEAAGKVLFAIESKLPRTYGELIEKQKTLAIEQARDFQKWLAKQALKKDNG